MQPVRRLLREERTPANGDGAAMPQTFIQNGAPTEKAKKFIADFQQKNKLDRIPSAVSAAQGYDSMYLIAAAIEQAGGTEGPKIKAALENLQKPYEGVIATFNKPFSAAKPKRLRTKSGQESRLVATSRSTPIRRSRNIRRRRARSTRTPCGAWSISPRARCHLSVYTACAPREHVVTEGCCAQTR